MNFRESTDQLYQRFEASLDDPLSTIERMVRTGVVSHTEAIAAMTCANAGGLLESVQSPVHELQLLIDWYRLVRADCSAHYRELKIENPLLSRAEVNQDSHLTILNGIRRGLRQSVERRNSALVKMPTYARRQPFVHQP